MRDRILIAAGAAFAVLACIAACTNEDTDAAKIPFRNPALSFEERARDLVGRMTLEEKARQFGHKAPAIARLGVPEYNWWSEGLHGVARAGHATVFPQAIAMAATFDEPFMRETADIISTEFRAKYLETRNANGGSDWYRGLTVWSPNINIFRDPRWGRGQETYGEDPYLTARLGVAFIAGLQGSDPKYLKTIATSKHYAVHSGPESNRHKEDVHPTPHDLEDTYLPAFRATVIEGKVGSVMCVYNAVDGVPGCASSVLLDDYLRNSWDFHGYVVSDCGAAANIYREDAHHWKPNATEGVAAGINAGMDLICGDFRNNWTTEADAIVEAVTRGLLKQEVLDRALVRLFVARLKLGLFEPPASVPFASITAADNDTAAHREHALRAAQKAMVLLKNANGLLPLRKEPASIAVIGPNADSRDALLGNYNGEPSSSVTVLAGLRKRFPNARVNFVEGTGFIGPITSAVPAAALSKLKAEIYDNIELEGNAAPPRDVGAADLWSIPASSGIRWTGRITAPESGEYRFGFQTLDGYRVWVDGKLLIEDWSQREFPSLSTGKATLEANRSYDLRIEAYNKHEAFANATSTIGGLVWSLPSRRGDDAVAAARDAELVVFVGGLSPRIEGEEMRVVADGFAGGDRTSLDLPAPQQKLLERVSASGKPIVLVLMNGSALSINWADRHVPAIIDAWYPGEEGGTAVAGLIAGDFSPAGRLPVTFYKSVDDLPPFEDYSMAKRTYRYFPGEVLYPFGHGLSYTTFKYDNLELSSPSIAAQDTLDVSVDITNTGKVESDEVAQLYLSHPGVEGAPLRALKGFKRVHLKPGEKQTVSFSLGGRALSTVNPAGVHIIAAGDVELWVGGGQPVARAGQAQPAGIGGQFKIVDSMELPK